MDVLGFATLAVGGFTACAEFGSYAFVHPVIRRLPAAYHIEVEQGLLRTFGRVMPVLMTATLALGVANALAAGGQGGPAGWRWAAAAAYIAALTSTVIFNVPVNLATGRWDPQHPPEQLEAGPQPVGVLPGTAFLAAADRVRAHLRRIRDRLKRTVMNILVFGATGPLGRRVVDRALSAGHQVTAFVRTPGRLGPHPGLREVTGDVLDTHAVSGRRSRA